jgi:hypothetical protein
VSKQDAFADDVAPVSGESGAVSQARVPRPGSSSQQAIAQAVDEMSGLWRKNVQPSSEAYEFRRAARLEHEIANRCPMELGPRARGKHTQAGGHGAAMLRRACDNGPWPRNEERFPSGDAPPPSR